MAGWFCGYLMINNKALAWTGHRHHVVHYLVFACFSYLYISLSPGPLIMVIVQSRLISFLVWLVSLRQTVSDTNLLLLFGTLSTSLPAARARARVCVCAHGHCQWQWCKLASYSVSQTYFNFKFILWNSHFSLSVLSTALLNFIVLDWLFILATSTDIYNTII